MAFVSWNCCFIDNLKCIIDNADLKPTGLKKSNIEGKVAIDWWAEYQEQTKMVIPYRYWDLEFDSTNEVVQAHQHRP